MKIKPNFLIIGAAKCGTTTLHHEISKHPDIYISPKKDFKFFDNDENYKKGLKYYETYFNGNRSETIIGEANSEYIFSEKAAERIKTDLGSDVKLILILRNPVDRSFSEYKHQKKYDRTQKPFAYFLKKENLTCKEDREIFSTIIDRSQYKKHIEKYLAIFPRENIQIVILEKLTNNPSRINFVFEFLGVNQLEIEELQQANKAFVPKSKWINNLILKPNGFRKILKILIPSFKVREKVRRKIKNINSKNIETEQSLKPEIRQFLWNKYFDKEKEFIEEQMKISIDEWKS